MAGRSKGQVIGYLAIGLSRRNRNDRTLQLVSLMLGFEGGVPPAELLGVGRSSSSRSRLAGQGSLNRSAMSHQSIAEGQRYLPPGTPYIDRLPLEIVDDQILMCFTEDVVR